MPEITEMSLAQHFAAPDEYIGEFGWVCGYSADAAFMDLAAERFTTENAAARAAGGCRRLGLLLDPVNPQLTSAAAPGVLHFGATRADLPFRLLHAKVAVLGFRQLGNATDWQLRVLVSTGNWTRATLDGNIDLVWRVDIDSRLLDATNAADCADLAAAWDLLTWLRPFFNTRILDAVPAGRSETDTHLAWQNLERWAAQAAKNAQGSSRFIDNRGQSLWAHVQRKTKSSKEVRRNYLAMGSAYYQGAGGTALPSVLKTIVTGLQEAKELTASAEVDLYVNPQACQAVAAAVQAIAADDWTVRRPRMQGGQKFLHAKFIFSARHRDGSNECGRPWLYFGSGNLTVPGFLKRASAASGNLEAGVVLQPEYLLWHQDPGADPAHVIENLLPLQWTQEATPGTLQPGEDMADREARFIAPPLAWLMWQGDGAQAGWLLVPDHTGVPFDLVDSSGAVCVRDAVGRIRWDAPRPVQVGVRWIVDGTPCNASVPVIDEQGGIGTIPGRPLGLDEVGWALSNFPGRPIDDDQDRIDCPAPPLSFMPDDGHGTAGRAATVQYPIRLMMQQLDTIADIQCNVDPLDWRTWCNRLEQVLCQAGDSAEVVAFRTLGIDPLSALLAPAFRPVYAETGATEDGRRYEATLARIALAWQVNGLDTLGEAT